MRRDPTPAETALTALFFLAATLVMTWPIGLRAGDGLADLWDAKLNAWILHWDYHQTFRDPLHLYDANIFYPARYSLAFSENLFGAAVFAFPLYAAGLSTLAVYNIVFLLGMFLSGLAAWALAREAIGDPVAAGIAGLVFAFCPWRIAQIPHIQFQWGAFLALSLLFLLRYFDGGRRREAVLFGVCFAWNALCNVHYALFSGLLIAVVLIYEGLVTGWRAFRPRLFAAVASAAVAGLAVTPFLLPYGLASRLYGMERSDAEIEVFSATWTGFLTAGGQNKLYGPVTQKWAKPEGELFPGIVPLALAGAALLRRRRAERKAALRQAAPGQRRIARVLDVLVLVCLVLAAASLTGRTVLGPLKLREPGRIAVVLTILLIARLTAAFPGWSRFEDLGDFLRRLRFGARVGLFLAIAILGIVVALGTNTPYYRFLVQSFGPTFHAIRAPSRGVVLFDLGLGVLAAWGLSEVTRNRGRAVRLSLTGAAVLAIGFEYRAFPLEVRPVDPKPPPVYPWLAGMSFPGGLVEWPLGNSYDQEHEFRSTAHWKPILNGASGFAPRSYEELAGELEKRPIPDSIWEMLDRRKATLLLFHVGQVDGEAASAYLEAIGRGVEQRRIELARSFGNGDSRDFLFRLSPAPAAALPESPAGESKRDRALLDLIRHPPFGHVDLPAEGEAVEPGASVVGWALDDSGISSVTVAIDAGSPAPALAGLWHPGPARVYPKYPGAETAGFVFAIPPLSTGGHVLTVMVTARDGGKTRMTRNFIAR